MDTAAAADALLAPPWGGTETSSSRTKETSSWGAGCDGVDDDDGWRRRRRWRVWSGRRDETWRVGWWWRGSGGFDGAAVGVASYAD